MDVVNFNEAEIPRPGDVTAISERAREAFDALTEGALGWPSHWSRLSVVTKDGSADIVQIAPGELYQGSEIYSSKELIEQNLQSYKPLLATEERWVALRQVPDPDIESVIRAVETSPTPLTVSTPVNQSLPKYNVRRFTIDVVAGAVTVPPASYPAIPDNVSIIAWVRLTTEGIQEIVSNQNLRVKSVYEIEGRLQVAEKAIEVLTLTTQSIITDLAAVAQSVRHIPPRQFFAQLANTAARTERELAFPDDGRNYLFDHGLQDGFWDFGHADSAFRIDQGIRHQFEAVSETQMVLADAQSPDVSVYGNTIVFPAHTEDVKISSAAGGVRKDISNTTHTVTTATQHTVSHSRTDFGPTVNVCENQMGWEGVRDSARAQKLFAKDGQQFQAKPIDHPWDANMDVPGHQWVAVQQVIHSSWTETYTTYHTEEFGLNGAVFGQTFLNGQAIIATSIDLNFTRVGSTGDVLLCICELNPSGSPDFSSVIARVNKPQSELTQGWVKFQIPPTHLKQGKRYAWFTVTTGNHQLSANSGNTFAGGSLFVCTDGIWSQVSTTEDFAFRLNGAKFLKQRVELLLNPASLNGGLTQLTFIFKSIIPAGTTINFEIQPTGQNEWFPLDARDPSVIANLPPQVLIRAVFNGTVDVMPGMVLDTDARVIAGRMNQTMQAVSDLLSLGFATETVEVIYNVDNFDAARHTVAPKLLVNDAPVNPASVTPIPDPTKDSRVKYKAVFDFTGAAISDLRLRVDQTTDSYTKVPFGQDVQINAF